MGLTIIQQGVITLVRSAICGKPFFLQKEFSINDALPLIRAHAIQSMAYVGSKYCGINDNGELFRSCCGCIAKQEMQDSIYEEITKVFDEAGIDYLALKGAHLRKLYPKPYMRNMGDIDILIRMEQYNSIRSLMNKIGFIEGKETDHELYWHKSGVLIELHKHLIPSYNYDFYDFFGNGWQMIMKDACGHCYMTWEDEFVFVFTHFVKHYRDGGIGLTQLTDLWVLRNKYNESQVENKLEKLHLLVFYQNIMKVLDAVFADGTFDEKTLFILGRILDSGMYGTKEKRKMAQVVRKVHNSHGVLGARISEPLRILFPSYDDMCKLFPLLVGRKYLLPIMWIRRIIKKTTTKKRTYKEIFDDIQMIDHIHSDEYQKELEYVGLDFWF